MRISADQALSPPPASAIGHAVSSPSGSNAPAHGGVSNKVVLSYLLVTIAALLPGLAAQFLPVSDSWSAITPFLDVIRTGLLDIRFGGGLRFWFGVTGAALMGMLLLYPIRKALAKGRGLGRIGAWFHLHIIIGFAGPALILYHSNFGTGGTNANVAMWAMLAIAISGLVGQFVYRRVSAGFYGDKTLARGHLDQLKQLFIQIDGMHPAKMRLIDDLESFDATLLTPRQGISASLRRRVRIEERAHYFMREIASLTGAALRTQTWAPGQHRQVHNAMIGHLRAYVRFARSGAGRAVREQIWARWRLFHMPLFLIMCVATVLHIIAVWNMDAGDPNRLVTPPVEEAQTKPALPSTTPTPKKSGGLQQLAVRTSRVEVTSEASVTPSKTVDNAGAAAKPAPVMGPAPSSPRQPENGPGSIDALLANDTHRNGNDDTAAQQAPVAPTPVPVKRPMTQSKPQAAQKPAEEPTAKVAAKKNDAFVPPPPPVEVIAQAPKAGAAPTATVPDKDTGQAAIAELQKRNDEPAPLMGLGVRGRSLSDQIALLKAKMKDGTFHHNDAETGFALTGKHVKVDCANCHQKPLREARQPKARACIDCHKQDDIHRGRRPDCAQCHVPTRWSQIVDRKKK